MRGGVGDEGWNRWGGVGGGVRWWVGGLVGRRKIKVIHRCSYPQSWIEGWSGVGPGV
jgi:hypothetical protein